MLFFISAALGMPQELLEDATLSHVLGEYSASEDGFVRLIQDLAAEDPVRGRALLLLAQSRLEYGDRGGAQERLRECIRTGPGRADCTALMSRIELEVTAIHTIPTVWTFDASHGLVHLWTQAERGSIRIDRSTRNPVLVWTTRQEEAEPGMVLFARDLNASPPHTLVFDAMARDQDAWLVPVFLDDTNTVFQLPNATVHLSAGVPHSFKYSIADAMNADRHLDPSTLERIVLRDISGERSSADHTTIILDNVGLR